MSNNNYKLENFIHLEQEKFHMHKTYLNSLLSSKPEGSILCLDIGEKKIGVAKCHLSILLPIPFAIIKRSHIVDEDINKMKKIASEEKALLIVVGLPINMDYTLSSQSLAVIEFTKLIENNLQLPLLFCDERLSTKAANTLLKQSSMKRKDRDKVDDKVAATLILDTFIQKYCRIN